MTKRRVTALVLLLAAGLTYAWSFRVQSPLSYALGITGVTVLTVAVAVGVGGYRPRSRRR